MAPADHLDVSELRSELGSALRAAAVGDLDDRDYDVLYMRPDVEEKYSTEAQDRIFEDLVFEYVASPAREDDFEPLGDLNFTIRSFENGHVVMCWEDDLLLYVSLDPSSHFVPPTMRLLQKQLQRYAAA